MCGIAGFYDSTKSFDRSALELMTRCIAHRGPDADGFFTDDIIGLGHRRLSIIDLSAEANQPMFSHDKRYVVVFNGEIYNYQEVAKVLQLQQHTHSDTEVILESFAKENVTAIQRWNGMYSMALYD